MAIAPAKYIFDLDMGEKPKNTRVVSDEDIAQMVEKARQEGYQKGFREGENGKQIRETQNLLSAANKLVSECIKISNNREQLEKEALTHAINLSTSIGRKLASKLIDAQPQVELEALIKECLTSLEDAPHLVIRCHPDLAKISQEVAEQQIQISGFSGKLVVMGDPDIALSDGKIEWADGGLIRDCKAINMQIDNAINNYLKAHKILVIQPNDDENKCATIQKMENDE